MSDDLTLLVTTLNEEKTELKDLLYRLATIAASFADSCATPESQQFKEDRQRLRVTLSETQGVLLRT